MSVNKANCKCDGGELHTNLPKNRHGVYRISSVESKFLYRIMNLIYD